MESEGELIKTNEERMFICVRLRPLNEKEISSNDVSDWECINGDTIVYKNASLLTTHDRLMYPTAYKFDRVFKSDCSTRTVYEEGAKLVVTSVVHGVNSTVFAYGETSNGKTYTMTGITEYAIADIYDYIHMHPEREFNLKFSAMEIYNDSVRDLLSVDNTPLRLVDDPERGTVVENLMEEILRDRDHVTELLFICEAQRQMEETSFNDTSSLAHQIIRLTVESSPRGSLFRDSASTHAAFLNFVDLAGSELESQSLSTDSNLKTSGAVISQLSKEMNGNIPFRDSKLTQILQTSLRGNSRTAIICTMSPARSRVEQSRNTLHFASCAMEVTTNSHVNVSRELTTNSHVNVVMSDKSLVDHLQKEIERLENELRSNHHPNFTSLNYSALLREKDAQIKKLEKENKDLLLQVKELSRMLGEDVGLGQYPHLRVHQSPNRYVQEQANSLSEEFQCSDVDISRSSSQHHNVKIPSFEGNASPRLLSCSSNFSESDSFYGLQEFEKQIKGNLEDLCREVGRMETEHSINRGTTEPNHPYSEDNSQFPAIKVHVNEDDQAPLDEEIKDDDDDENENISSGIMPSKEGQDLILASVEQGKRSTSSMLTEESHIQYPGNAYIQELSMTPNRAEDSFGHRHLRVVTNKSSKTGIAITDSPSPWFKTMDYGENTPNVERVSGKHSQPRLQNDLDMEIHTMAGEFLTAETPDIREDDASKYKLFPMKNVKFDELDQKEDEVRLTSWPVEFRKLRRQMIELWHACNISLVHRSYFFLLFQGDPSDAIYLEVEIRRTKVLKDKFSRGDKIVVDGRTLTLSSSAKALRQERRMLSEQMMKKFTDQEREKLFVDWGIGLNTKLRRLQLAHLIWSKTDDVNHIAESAFLVAKLVGFIEPGQTPSTEMFGVNFTPKSSAGFGTFKRSLGLGSLL